MGLSKRKLVRALVDVWARAAGCLRTYLRMMDRDEGGDEKRMGGTKEVVASERCADTLRLEFEVCTVDVMF